MKTDVSNSSIQSLQQIGFYRSYLFACENLVPRKIPIEQLYGEFHIFFLYRCSPPLLSLGVLVTLDLRKISFTSVFWFCEKKKTTLTFNTDFQER